ncbi:MAG: phosphoribosylamine--glycine ligase [Gemmatimonadaceae bacterium]|nr:phosphoribosylamine--glycine ligase [Gemmatimonadaceae bacterium]
MKALIVGGGGREHAIAWKLAADDPTLELIAAPGNPGIATLARCEPIAATDVDALVALARREGVGLVVVGPEAPLDLGLVDALRAAGIPAFGPTAAAARIESSKRFSKELMQRAGVPTAAASTHTDPASARAAVRALGAPVVIKASGIAAGKGVIIALSIDEADAAIDAMLVDHAFGSAGAEVLVEAFMQGEECSLFVLTDGTNALPLLPVQDHKRIGVGDTGPNTGGMGAYAPVSIVPDARVAEAMRLIIEPTLRAMRDAGTPFTGLLYAGLMYTNDGPMVVEFNCRFGDPETQAILPMMASSLLEPMLTIARGESLANAPAVRWHEGASVTTVVAAPGYPGPITTGASIALPADAEGVVVFHAGTARDASGALRTAGGRVVAVTARAASFAAAQRASRAAAAGVRFEGAQFRDDIGWREQARLDARTP